MIFSINETNPQMRLIDKTVKIIEDGGVIIYPTDTVYAYGCDALNKKAIETIYRVKKLPKNKPLSFVCNDLSQVSQYANNISNQAFKIMKKLIPGPYTFILQASKLIPKIAITNQKTVGIRIPENNIALAIVEKLGRPIISASVNTSEGEYVLDPQFLEKEQRNVVDVVIDSGKKLSEPSTIINFINGSPEIIREGKGSIDF